MLTKKQKKFGFTLVEMLIVVSILIIVSLISYTTYNGIVEKSYSAKTKTNLQQFQRSLEAYKDNNNSLPDVLGNKNYYNKDGSYSHSNLTSFGVYGKITKNAFKDYTDSLKSPNIHRYYAYGKTLKNNKFELSGVIKKDGEYMSYVLGNYKKDLGTDNLIKEYNGPNFVFNKSLENFAYNPEEKKLTAKISEFTGTIKINANTYNSLNQVKNIKLFEGDKIKFTGAIGTKAIIYFSDGTHSELTPNTEIVLANMDYKQDEDLFTNIKIILNSGKFFTKASRLGEDSEFEVYTDDAIVAVRGTIFSVEKTTNHTKVEIIKGKIEIFKNDDTSVYKEKLRKKEYVNRTSLGIFPKNGQKIMLINSTGEMAKIPVIKFIKTVEKGPIQSNTIQVDVTNSTDIKYGFSNDKICDSNDEINNNYSVFTIDKDFIKETKNGKYLCIKATNTSGTSYKASIYPLNIDITPATINLNGRENITINQNDSYTELGAIYDDNIDGTGTILPNGTIDTSIIGNQELNYDYTDKAGNTSIQTTRKVTIKDSTPPRIEFIDDVSATATKVDTIKIKVTDYALDTYNYGFSNNNICNATDTYPETFTNNTDFTIRNEDNNGKYICVKATDSEGNTSYKASSNPLNIDLTAPNLQLIGDTTIEINKDEGYTDSGATCSDGTVELESNNVNTSSKGEYTVKYKCTDIAGNSSETERIVKVFKNQDKTNDWIFNTTDTPIHKSILDLFTGTSIDHTNFYFKNVHHNNSSFTLNTLAGEKIIKYNNISIAGTDTDKITYTIIDNTNYIKYNGTINVTINGLIMVNVPKHIYSPNIDTPNINIGETTSCINILSIINSKIPGTFSNTSNSTNFILSRVSINGTSPNKNGNIGFNYKATSSSGDHYVKYTLKDKTTNKIYKGRIIFNVNSAPTLLDCRTLPGNDPNGFLTFAQFNNKKFYDSEDNEYSIGQYNSGLYIRKGSHRSKVCRGTQKKRFIPLSTDLEKIKNFGKDNCRSQENCHAPGGCWAIQKGNNVILIKKSLRNNPGNCDD